MLKEFKKKQILSKVVRKAKDGKGGPAPVGVGMSTVSDQTKSMLKPIPKPAERSIPVPKQPLRQPSFDRNIKSIGKDDVNRKRDILKKVVGVAAKAPEPIGSAVEGYKKIAPVVEKGIENIKKVGEKIKQNVKDVPAYTKERVAQAISERKADKGADKLTKVLMGPAKGSNVDRFPSYTVIGEGRHAKRTKEIKNLIKQGKINEAKDFISKKRKEFDEMNPQ